MRLRSVRSLPGYHLAIVYDDGVEGIVNLSHLVGKGVFDLWTNAAAFERVTIGSHGEVRWTEQVELCSDSLYMQVTGKSVEEVLPLSRR